MHNMLANAWIDSQYGAKRRVRPSQYAWATYGMSHVRVCIIYSMDMHHILIILESKCAKYIMNDALQMHVIGWLLHKSARDKWHRLHQHSQDAFGRLYMYMVSRRGVDTHRILNKDIHNCHAPSGTIRRHKKTSCTIRLQITPVFGDFDFAFWNW